MAINKIKDLKNKTLPLGARWEECSRCRKPSIRYGKHQPYICDNKTCYDTWQDRLRSVQ